MPAEATDAKHPQRALSHLLLAVCNDSQAPHDLVLGALISLYRHIAPQHTPAARKQSFASPANCTTKDECAACLHDIGTLQRTRGTLVAQMNQQIADITLSYQPQLQLLQTQIDGKFKGVHAWCEAHRAEITDNLRVKTANLLTGGVV